MNLIPLPPHSESAADDAGPSPSKKAKVAKGSKALSSGKSSGKGSKTAVASSSSTSAPTEEPNSSPSSEGAERAHKKDRHRLSETRTISRMTFPGTDYARKLTSSEALQVAEVATLSTNQLVQCIFKMQCKSMLSYKKAIFK
jgi:hypothetical protein